jgi:hypothetical protein
MKKSGVVMSAILIAVLSTAAFYSYKASQGMLSSWYKSSYWQSVVAGVMSTVIGVILGLPTAIWLHNKAEAETRQTNSAESARVERENRLRVLATVTEELTAAAPIVRSLASGEAIRHVHVNVARWTAIGSGGDLIWIGASDTTASLALAYEEIGTVNMIAAQWLTSATNAVAGGAAHEVRVNLEQLLQAQASDALPLLETAIEAVQRDVASTREDLKNAS